MGGFEVLMTCLSNSFEYKKTLSEEIYSTKTLNGANKLTKKNKQKECIEMVETEFKLLMISIFNI